MNDSVSTELRFVGGRSFYPTIELIKRSATAEPFKMCGRVQSPTRKRNKKKKKIWTWDANGREFLKGLTKRCRNKTWKMAAEERQRSNGWSRFKFCTAFSNAIRRASSSPDCENKQSMDLDVTDATDALINISATKGKKTTTRRESWLRSNQQLIFHSLLRFFLFFFSLFSFLFFGSLHLFRVRANSSYWWFQCQLAPNVWNVPMLIYDRVFGHFNFNCY